MFVYVSSIYNAGLHDKVSYKIYCMSNVVKYHMQTTKAAAIHCKLWKLYWCKCTTSLWWLICDPEFPYSFHLIWLVLTDPYVKLCLRSPDKRAEKRKTKTVKCTLSPIFNEAFSFNVANANIEESSLEIVVMDFDNIGRDELIGRIMLAGEVSDFCYIWLMFKFTDRISQAKIKK